ncbi:GNAT family N-acetyltransferase [Paractinoplanes rishiriensis]|uniref:N-acetyltransferase n=1 Tax=Paractinoplanes rishiriensis TaxID=1050105 RepID=A0A919MUW1_9ACTN|nr:GNAT family N-acetyltransferase [Actinoplanes rishiriensis]GIF00747.1 N-acetyltransferase [Actinoplanes rishiriensis]
MSLLFRPATGADADRVAALHTDSWQRHYRGAYTDDYLDRAAADDRRQVWTARLGTPSPATATILAEQDGELAGFAHVIFDDHATWGSLVDNLHVVAHRHRGGIGRQLLSRAAAAAVTGASAAGVHLWVLRQNTAAQAFYRACGAVCVETGVASAPGGDPAHLRGAPEKLRMAWPDAAVLAAGAG